MTLLRNDNGVSGFTLIEMLIVIAVSLILLLAVFNNLVRFFYSSAVDSETQNLVAMLRLAKSNSVSQIANSRYAVVLSASSFNLASDSGAIITRHNLPADVELTSITVSPVYFEKIKGLANSCPCAVTVRSIRDTSVTRQVSISSQGLISVN